MKKRVADIIMDTLADNGVEQAFCVVGGGAMYLNNALGITKRIKTIFNHHEQACAMAAEGYAKIKQNKPALVCVTTGPGGTNTLTGVMGAYLDSVPMIVISGQCRYNTSVPETGLPLRSRGVQEFNIVDTVKTMTKYSKMVIDPLEIKREVQKAYDIAMSGRRGPVWLDIPQNVQNAMVEESDLYDIEPEKAFNFDCKIEEVVTLLKNANRPVVFVSGGIRTSGQYSLFLKLLEKWRLPVIGGCVQPDVMYRDFPLYFGSSGTVGTRCGNIILQKADVILTLGASLTFNETGFVQENFAPNAKIIMLNIDKAESKKPGLRINTFVCADLKDFLYQGLSYAFSAPSKWIDFCNEIKNRFDVFEGAVNDDNGKVDSYNFWREYSKQEPANNITVLGNNSGVSPRLQTGNKTFAQRTVANINCGSMGYDVPAALGAAVAVGGQTVLVTGDGSVMMNLQELQTIKHYNLPVKIVIFSNDGYNGIRQTCKNYFNGLNVGCDYDSGISFPDFEKIANTFGFKNRVCHTNAEIQECLQWLFAQSGQAILIVEQKHENPPVPRVVSRLRADGTSEPAWLQDMYPFLDKSELDELMRREL